MSESYLVLTPPSAEPITLTQAKAYLRVDFTDDDQVISDIITRARVRCETVTGRAFCTQQIQEVFTIERPPGGEVSGPIEPGPNWYQFQEALGANPFGPARFYFDLAVPPVQPAQTLLIETKVYAFTPWMVFPQVTNSDGSTNTWLDNTQEPARLYIMSPITANFYRFTFWAGYDATQSYPLPHDLRQPMLELISHWYDNREGEDLPPDIEKKLLAKRIANAWV